MVQRQPGQQMGDRAGAGPGRGVEVPEGDGRAGARQRGCGFVRAPEPALPASTWRPEGGLGVRRRGQSPRASRVGRLLPGKAREGPLGGLSRVDPAGGWLGERVQRAQRRPYPRDAARALGVSLRGLQARVWSLMGPYLRRGSQVLPPVPPAAVSTPPAGLHAGLGAVMMAGAASGAQPARDLDPRASFHPRGHTAEH